MRLLPLHVPVTASLSGAPWLEAGYRTWLQAGQADRDYSLPRPRCDFRAFTNKPMGNSEAALYNRMFLAVLKVPVYNEDMDAWGTPDDAPLLPGSWPRVWSGHSERHTLPTILAVGGVAKDERDRVGRWQPSESDEYVRTYRATVKRLTAQAQEVCHSYEHYRLLDEEDTLCEGVKRLVERGYVEADLKVQADVLAAVFDRVARSLARQAPDVEAVPEAPQAAEPVVMDGVDWEDQELEAKYLIAYGRNRVRKCLHRCNGCKRARDGNFADLEYVVEDVPDSSRYNATCTWCFRDGEVEDSDHESSSSSSSSSLPGSPTPIADMD